MKQATIDAHFARLATNLVIFHLPVKGGKYRKADADEFMLMEIVDGRVRFKHRHTRNYVSQSELGNGFVAHADDFEYPELPTVV